MQQDGIVGVWKLEAFTLRDVDTGDMSQPFGPEPRGVLMLHPDGRLVALLTPGGGSAPLSEADQTSAFQKLVAYSGRYRLEPPDRLVTTVDVAWIAPWVGTEQVRTFLLDRDRLTISTPPNRMPRQGADDATVVSTLTWSREL